MKVLLAIDGSPHSHAALEEVASRTWPADTQIYVLTVNHSSWPLSWDPFFTLAAAHMDSVMEQQRNAPALLRRAVQRLQERAPALQVTTKAIDGVPHDVIVQEAETWGADLIVLGSHGYGRIRRALLGSVAAAVAVEAPCAVEIIRMGRAGVTVPRPRTEAPVHGDSFAPVQPERQPRTRSGRRLRSAYSARKGSLARLDNSN
jgi:nucleotide-binding universal stress UspA family protein